MSPPGYPRLPVIVVVVVVIVSAWSLPQRSDGLVLTTYSLDVASLEPNSSHSSRSPSSCRVFFLEIRNRAWDPPPPPPPPPSHPPDPPPPTILTHPNPRTDVSETTLRSKVKSRPYCLTSSPGSFNFNVYRPHVSRERKKTLLSSCPYDAYLPIPGNCLGHTYVIATGESTREGTTTHFVTVINKYDNPIHVQLAMGPYVSWSDIHIQRVEPTQSERLKPFSPVVKVDQMTNLLSHRPLDGLELSSDIVFAVIAGSWTGGMEFKGHRAPHLVAEMFPPTDAFEKDYFFVPSAPSPLTSPLAVKKVEILSLAKDGGLNGSVTVYPTQAPPQRLTFSLTLYGEVFKHASPFPIRITATSAILVVAVSYNSGVTEARASSLTLVPPISKWTRSAVLYPSGVTPASDVRVTLATVVIRTSNAPGLEVKAMTEGKKEEEEEEEVPSTSPLTFSGINGSDFSYSHIRVLPKTRLQLYHSEGQPFLVLRFGEADTRCLQYAVPVQMEACRTDSLMGVDSPTVVTPTRKSSVSKLVTLGVVVVVVVVMVSMVTTHLKYSQDIISAETETTTTTTDEETQA